MDQHQRHTRATTLITQSFDGGILDTSFLGRRPVDNAVGESRI